MPATPIKALWTVEEDIKEFLVLMTPFKAQLKTVEAVNKLFVETTPIRDFTIDDTDKRDD